MPLYFSQKKHDVRKMPTPFRLKNFPKHSRTTRQVAHEYLQNFSTKVKSHIDLSPRVLHQDQSTENSYEKKTEFRDFFTYAECIKFCVTLQFGKNRCFYQITQQKKQF